MQPKTIAGRIVLTGNMTFDQQMETFEAIEIRTPSGIVELPNVAVTAKAARYIAAGNTVALSYTPTTDRNNRPATMIWGTHVYGDDRTLFEEEIFKMRGMLNLLIVFLVVLIPFGLLFFVVPGLAIAWKLRKVVKQRNDFPTPNVLRASVESLRNIPKPNLESAPA